MRKLHEIPVGDWFLFNADLFRRLTEATSIMIHPDGAPIGQPFRHNPGLEVTTAEDMQASLIHPRARTQEFINCGDTYTILTKGDWNHPKGTLTASAPASSDEDRDDLTFTSKVNGSRFMDLPRCTTFRAELPPLSSYPFDLNTIIMETLVATPKTKPLTLKRQATKQADLDMVFRTHSGGEADITLQGRALNGKAEVTISRMFDPASPSTPALDFKLQGITLDEARALVKYFDSLAADIRDTQV